MRRFGVLNRGLKRIERLSEFLDADIVPVGIWTDKSIDATLGWGRRKYGRRASRTAEHFGVPFICLEDGFLRSVGLGKDSPPLSVVVDDRGIYYDAGAPSRLESLICRTLSDAERERATSLRRAWCDGRVSKYNHLREHVAMLPQKYVLVADQTYGDASIRFGLAGPGSFARMLQSAIVENPDCTVLVKIHPDVFAGRKKGHFDPAALAGNQRVRVLADDVHPARLIERAEAVYVVTSQIGFESLLWGKRVRTFGMPFYAGWGLTEDELPAPERRCPVSLENLVHAALVDYPRYVDPETGQRCEVERVLQWMALQRRMRERFPAQIYAVGFSRWKRPIVQRFLTGCQLTFLTDLEQVSNGAGVAVWGRKYGPALGSIPRIQIEDGFLRSVGLGADLVAPLSWVLDRTGIYYDATRPSDLENLLLTTDFTRELLLRAQALRVRLVAEGITKYNVGAAPWQRPGADKLVVLVPGQVESDASICFGAPGVRTNMGLLQAVREQRPGAYVVYKPHPDVVAGLRREGKDESEARRWCDEVVVDVPMAQLLEQVDEVQVMTSLTGFEALLRGKPVVTWGQPFYAGWGLTDDRMPVARRGRALPLDALVAAALILYPTYVSRTTRHFTTPERALDELVAWREAGGGGMPFWRRAWRGVMRLGMAR